jgi:hypothetical protein
LEVKAEESTVKDPAEMPVIGANHKRTISISLHLVDQRLCEWEQRLEGHLEKGVMYQLQDDIAPAQRKELRRRIAETRERLDSLRKKLGSGDAEPGADDCGSGDDPLGNVGGVKFQRSARIRNRPGFAREDY